MAGSAYISPTLAKPYEPIKSGFTDVSHGSTRDGFVPHTPSTHSQTKPENHDVEHGIVPQSTAKALQRIAWEPLTSKKPRHSENQSTTTPYSNY